MNLNKYQYFFDCVRRYVSPVMCPSCGAGNSKLIDRKYLVSRLFECSKCGLYYRHPLETPQTNRDFYQSQYQQADSVTTFMPDDGEDLERLKNNIAANPDNPKNAQRLRRIFEGLYPEKSSLSIVDYGASWGYISWQLKSFGMQVQSYEISVPRARYGNIHLDLNILTDENQLKGGNDIFFSSHVIEHVPSVANMLKLAASLTNKDGFIVTLCPNGSPEYRETDPSGFHKCWGQVHPNYLNAQFFRQYYTHNPLFLTSTPLDLVALANWDQKSHFSGDLSGGELLAIARPHHTVR